MSCVYDWLECLCGRSVDGIKTDLFPFSVTCSYRLVREWLSFVINKRYKLKSIRACNRERKAPHRHSTSSLIN